ncbi:VCBS repeat-containing protein [Rhodothermus bifroesti]
MGNSRSIAINLIVKLSSFLLILWGCRQGRPSQFVLRDPEESGLTFQNTIHEDARHNLMTFFYLYNGGGVAVGDINNDGLPDLYVTGNMISGRLYLNRGNLRFEDITERSGIVVTGWATGATFVDINEDGWLDLYICRSGMYPPEERANLLFINNGDLTFSEQASRYGIADTSYSTQAVFFDYDRDGYLDMYLLNHSMLDLQPNRIRPIDSTGYGIGNDRLYHNEGNGTFRDVTLAAGIRYPGMGLGVVVGDVNRDGWDDIYVANDFMASDYLYLNQGNGTFKEVGRQVFKHFSYSAMGVDLADINNDGWLDLVVVEMLPPDHDQRQRMAFPLTSFGYYQAMLQEGYHYQYWRNTLQLNHGLNAQGKLTFSEVGQLAGIDATDWSWAPLLADFDHDGYRDLWITNGYRRAVIDMDFIKDRMIPVLQQERRLGTDSVQRRLISMVRELYDLARPDAVFRNRGDGTFALVSKAWGITDPSFSNGAAYADLDRDGDLDVIVNRIDQPIALYENRGGQGHYVQLDLRGHPPNTRALGAWVEVYCDSLHWVQQHYVVRGYQSSVDYVMHLGLGSCAQIDSLKVRWPNGQQTKWIRLPVDTLLVLHQPEGPGAFVKPPDIPQGLLVERTDRLPPYRHIEDLYSDFIRQPLLPRTFSQLGPGLAVGDVNGDGREDFYVGGTYAQAGWLFLQQPEGFFKAGPIDPTAMLEDQGALFFDADGDGDLDLLVASGSGEFPEGSDYLRDRLYRNDGQGQLIWDPLALPEARTSSSVVRAADFDQDGDLDLFIGGRMRPLRYPLPGRSYLLRNEGGRFVEVTNDIAPGLGEAGMVNDALWSDYNNDGWPDLIVVGEFMPVRVWQNQEGRFREVTAALGLAHTHGWWNSITGGDFDQDGDIDYVAGNTGLNSRFRASRQEPIRVYAADFDGNGLIDPIMTFYLQGREVLVPRMDELFMQVLLPRALQVSSYATYARSHLRDLVYETQLKGAYVAVAYQLASSYLENQGDRFEVRPLPLAAQVAPIFGLLAEDVDGDGSLDLLAVGNDYATDVLTGRYDAFIGLWLRGDGKGNLHPVSHRESGFFVDGDAKALVRLQVKNEPAYLVAQNQGPLHLLGYRSAPPVSCWPWPSEAVYAQLHLPAGRVERRERYWGSGYLSQSSATLCVSKKVQQVTFHAAQGKTVQQWVP